MPTPRRKRAAFDHHGLYLVPDVKRKAHPASNFVYRIVAVGAALFLAMTVC
jgi:hypothetical protein